MRAVGGWAGCSSGKWLSLGRYSMLDAGLQIRSIDMHQAAEGGKAAHWRYHADKSRLSAMRKIAIGLPRRGGVDRYQPL
jgi:hypothetical protein